MAQRRLATFLDAVIDSPGYKFVFRYHVKLGQTEVFLSVPERKEYSRQSLGDIYDCNLVSAQSACSTEIGIERMPGAGGMVSSLAQHRPKFG